MKSLPAPAEVARKFEVVPPLSVREEIPPHIKWLIDNYDPPPALVDDLGRSSVKVGRYPGVPIKPKAEETLSPSVERAAVVYQVRERKETFIEWLWRNYPPTTRPCT